MAAHLCVFGADGLGVVHQNTVRSWLRARARQDGSPGRYVNVKADRAALRARRIVHGLVDDERGRSFA